MTTRNHSKSRSPAKRDACRMSQTSTIARLHSLIHSCLHPHLHARIFLTHSFRLYHSRLEPSWRTSQHRSWRPRLLNRVVPRIVGTRQRRLPRRFRGLLRLFTSRMLTLSRVHASPLFSHVWPLPFCPTRDRHLLRPFSPFRDGHYWCSKCPRRGFTTIPGLMRHVTHQHAGSSVDEATCSLFAAIERVTRLWWPQKNGRSGLQSMRAGQSGQAPSSG